MRLALGFLILAFTPSCYLLGQLNIDAIHPLEDAQGHYVSLQELDAGMRSEFQWMDTIIYPPEDFNNYIIALAMLEPVYLSSSQVAYLTDALRYPANSSAQTRAELDYLLDLQNSRTAEEVERVQYLAGIGYWPTSNYLDAHVNYERNLQHLFFECREVVGEQCTAGNYPLTSKLLQGVMNDMRLMEFAIKFELQRARPYQLDPKIKPLREIGSHSFVSGHTLWAYIQAFTWSELMPEKRKEFIDLAYEIGLSREIMGVHYPSDEEGARQMAHRMLYLMWHTDKFQADFAAAKDEWR